MYQSIALTPEIDRLISAVLASSLLEKLDYRFISPGERGSPLHRPGVLVPPPPP